MSTLTAPARFATSEQLAERAFRRPSSTIWLNHVCVSSPRFDEALRFYVSTLGLTLRTVEIDPTEPSRLRALLVDAEDRDILEIQEHQDDEREVANVSQLGFSLPRRSWLLLRARLDAQSVPYRLTGDCLLVEDVDGILLRVAPLGEC